MAVDEAAFTYRREPITDLTVDIPETGPVLVPGTVDTVTVDEELVYAVTDEWEDDQPVHVVPGLAAVLAAETGLFDPEDIDADDLLLPGVGSVYAAVRRASGPVECVTAEFTAPLTTGDTVMVDRAATDAGEQVTVSADESGEAAAIDLQYADGDLPEGYNDRAAYKVAAPLGTHSQEGNILLGIDAALEPGDGEQALERDAGEPVKEADDYDIAAYTYTYDDGSEITYTLLQLDEAVYDDVLDEYAADADRPVAAEMAAYRENPSLFVDLGTAPMDVATAYWENVNERKPFPWSRAVTEVTADRLRRVNDALSADTSA